MKLWYGAAVIAAAAVLSACGEVVTERRQTSEFFVFGPEPQVRQFADAERARDPELKVDVEATGPGEAVATFQVSDGDHIVALGGRAAAAKLSYGNRRELVVRSSVGAPESE